MHVNLSFLPTYIVDPSIFSLWGSLLYFPWTLHIHHSFRRFPKCLHECALCEWLRAEPYMRTRVSSFLNKFPHFLFYFVLLPTKRINLIIVWLRAYVILKEYVTHFHCKTPKIRIDFNVGINKTPDKTFILENNETTCIHFRHCGAIMMLSLFERRKEQ